LTERAIEFLDGCKSEDAPFFLFVGYVDTHSPFCQHPHEWVEKYRDARFADVPIESAVNRGGWTVFGAPPDQETRLRWLREYYAAVSSIDAQVGALLATLERIGRLDETIVIYTSDHGHMNGHHGLYTKGNATVPQNFYEESIRVPLLVRGPCGLMGGQVVSEFVDHCDLFSTLVGVGANGISLRSDRIYPGKSWIELATAGKPTWRDRQYAEYGNARMVRSHSHKLIVFSGEFRKRYSDELYDLNADPRETENLIGRMDYQHVESELRAQLSAHFDRHSIPGRAGSDVMDLPRSNASHEPWRMARPERTPPEGSHFRLIAGY
jgi:arylsulfatase A-like enzyme